MPVPEPTPLIRYDADSLERRNIHGTEFLGLTGGNRNAADGGAKCQNGYALAVMQVLQVPKDARTAEAAGKRRGVARRPHQTSTLGVRASRILGQVGCVSSK